MCLNIENNKMKDFEIETLAHPQIEIEEFPFPSKSLSEIDMQLQLKKENLFQKQMYSFKEYIFYNNLPYDTLNALNINSSTTDYDKHYYTPFKDFDSTYIEHLQQLRHQYMLKLNSSKSTPTQPVITSDTSNDQAATQHTQCMPFQKLINNLLLTMQSKHDISLKHSIINRLLNNMTLFFKSSSSSSTSNAVTSNEDIETTLIQCINLFTNEFITNSNTKSISPIAINGLVKFQYISLHLHSFYLFYKVNSILHELNISVNNYKQIYTMFFKRHLTSTCLFKDNSILPYKTLLFGNKNEIYKYTFLTKNNYVYLLIQYKPDLKWNLYKLKPNAKNSKFLIYNETHINLKDSLKVKMSTSLNYASEQIVICSIGNKSSCVLMYIDKHTLKQLAIKEFKLNYSASTKVHALFATSSHFHVITDDSVYEINYVKQSFIFNKYKCKDDVDVVKTIEKANGFEFNDEYVYIPSRQDRTIVYDVNKRMFKSIDNVFPNTYYEGYYDSYNRYYVVCSEKLKQIEFSYYKMKEVQLMFTLGRSQVMKEINDGMAECVARLKKSNNSGNSSDKVFNVDNYLTMNDYFTEYNSNYNDIDFVINTNNSNDYYNYFILLLTKMCIYYGETSDNEMNRNMFMKFYNNEKFLHEIFTLFINASSSLSSSLVSTLSNVNSKISKLLPKCYLIIMKSFITSSIASKSYTTNFFNKLNEIFDYMFTNITHNIDNDIYMDIVMLLIQRFCFIEYSYPNVVNSYITNTSTHLTLKLFLLCYKLHEIKLLNEMNINVIETCIEFENELLINQHHKRKDLDGVTYKYLHEFKQLLQDTIITWLRKQHDQRDETLFRLLFKHFNTLIEHLISSTQVIHVTTHNSVLCSCVLFAVNYFITRVTSSQPFNYSSVYKYISLIKPIYHNLNVLYSQQHMLKHVKHDLLTEEQILISSEHPCEFDRKKYYDKRNLLTIEPKQNESKVYVSFDPLSYINKPGNILYENAKYHTVIPMQSQEVNVNELKIQYLPQTLELAKVKEGTELSYGFDMKIDNYSGSTTCDDDVVYDINRVIVYSIGYFMKCIVNMSSNGSSSSGTSSNEHDDTLFQQLFNSKLFEHVSLNSTKITQTINEQTHVINSLINTATDDNYIQIKQKLSTLLNNDTINDNNISSSSSALSTVQTIVTKLYPDYTIDSNYNKTINALHAQFVAKNVWGSLSAKQIQPVVMGLFTIVLKNEKLLLLFDAFVSEYTSSSSSSKPINTVTNYTLFYTIYVEVSKIKKWFTQKQNDIAEALSKRNSMNESVDNIIQHEIDVYVVNLHNKINFILNALNVNEQPLSLIYHVEYTQNIQDVIDTLFTYIQTDLIDVSTLTTKITSQNIYATTKSFALQILNIFLNISTHPQNIKDIITWFNSISKNNSPNHINYITHDISGATVSHTAKLQLELYAFQMLLIQTLKQPLLTSLTSNVYDVSFYITAIQSLIYPFKQRDHPFLQLSEFFTLFDAHTIVSQIIYSNLPLQTAHIAYNDILNYNKVDYCKLYTTIYEFYNMYSYLVFNKFTTHRSQLLSNADDNDNETLMLMCKISEIVIGIITTYIERMRCFKASGSNINETSLNLVSEEKLNAYLHVLYRSLSFTNKYVYHFMEHSSLLLSHILEVMLYCSDKNKLICLNILSLFILNTTTNIKATALSYLRRSFTELQTALQIHHNDLYTYILTFKSSIDSSEHWFFVLFVFTYVYLLQQDNNENAFYKTDIDFNISFSLIHLLRQVITNSNNVLSQCITDYAVGMISKYITQAHPHVMVALLLFGCSNDYSLGVGSDVLVNVDKKETDVHNNSNNSGSSSSGEYDINIFAYNDNTINNAHDELTHKKGVVVGFYSDNKQIFETCMNTDNTTNTTNTNSNDTVSSSNDFSKFQFALKNYAFVALNSEITKDNIEGTLLKPIVVETKELIVYNNNPFTNKRLYDIVVENDIISILIRKFDALIDEFKYVVMSLLRKFISIATQRDDHRINIQQMFNMNVLNMFIKTSQCSYNSECGICSLEELETRHFKYICMFKCASAYMKRSTLLNANTNANTINVIEPSASAIEHQGDVFLSAESFFVKFNENLIKEFHVNKLLNVSLFTNNDKYYPFYKYESETINSINDNNNEYVLAMDSAVLTAHVIKLLNTKSNLKCIITNDNVSEYKLCEFPVIVMNANEYEQLCLFLFEQQPNDEYQNFFMESLQKDFTMLLDIPIEMISETVHLSQRDLILNVLNESTSVHVPSAASSSSTTNNVNSDNTHNQQNEHNDNVKMTKKEMSVVISKMNSLSARRLIMMLITIYDDLRHRMDNIDNVIKLLKMLLYELNVLQLNKGNNMLNDVVQLIRRFIYNVCCGFDKHEHDRKLITKLLSVDFLRNTNHIDYSVLTKLKTESELMLYDNIENNFKIIFAVLPQMKTLISFDIYNYEMQVFTSLIKKSNELIKTSTKTFAFVFDILLQLLMELNVAIQSDTASSTAVKALEQYKGVFFSNDFAFFVSKAESLLNENEPQTTDNDNKIFQLIFMYFELAFNMQLQYDIDLNVKQFYDMKLTEFYFNYALLSNKLNNKITYLYFLQQLNLIPQSSKPSTTQIIPFHYYDTSFTVPHTTKLSFVDEPAYTNIEITVNDVDTSLLGDEHCVFVYADSQCQTLQHYIRSDQRGKSFYIQHEHGNNELYVSFPYTKYKTDLFGSGSNEKQSLGCDGDVTKKYVVPEKCVGLDKAKNIIDFKFGYYHTFVTTMDHNLYTCGGDSGSSFKIEDNYGMFNLNTHFQDLVQKEGITGIWVNNFNASILVTKENNVYGCGNNNEYCLTDKLMLNDVITVPIMLPPFKQKVTKVACGFKATFFIVDDGTGYTVGSNTFRQCGSMEEENEYKKYFHLLPPPNSAFRDVVAGEEYFLMLIDEPNWKGRLYSLGSNECGRAGVGRDSSNRLQKCKGVEHLHFKIIASRNESTAAVTVDGYLYTFGFNGEGALGQGNTTNYYQPAIVKSVKDYIIDSVGISHNHMVLVGRSRSNGKRYAFSCGTHQYECLAYAKTTGEHKVLTPKIIPFFLNKQPCYEPMEVSVSRYQSYFMTMLTKVNDDLRMEGNNKVKCGKCKKDVEYVLRFYISSNNGKYVFICEDCVGAVSDNDSVYYCVTTPYEGITTQIEMIKMNLPFVFDITAATSVNDDDNTVHCVECKDVITHYVYMSELEPTLTLCSNCVNTKCKLILFPQLFYVINTAYFKWFCNAYKVSSQTKYTHYIYHNVKHSETPILTLEITKHYSKYDELLLINKDEHINAIYESFWKKISKKQLTSLSALKLDVETNQLANNKHANFLLSNDAFSIYNYMKALTDNTMQYQSLLHLNEHEMNLLYNVSSAISDSIYKMLHISTSNKTETCVPFYQEAISDYLEIINSKERVNLFTERLDKMKINVRPQDKEISINRHKAARFYPLNKVDTTGENTVFGQFYHKMKNFPSRNYLSLPGDRIFAVKLLGEGSTDYGGPYNEVLSIICKELQSKCLDLFIPTPNNKNDVGKLRDKYIPNPSAKSVLALDMYHFIGCLFGHVVSSGHLLSFNFHPLFWSKVTSFSKSISFSEIESIDKYFYKHITAIESFPLSKTQKEFEEAFPELTFTITLSNNEVYELIPKGKETKVTLHNKQEYTMLAKKARIEEFDTQVRSIRAGLLSVIPYTELSLLMGKDLELLVCGESVLDVAVLQQFTEYSGYTRDAPVVVNFWKALKEFTPEERESYLKYVWGRTRLPDPNVNKFTHVIAKMSGVNQDKRLPTASTCYFTLELPNYSSYEILKEKLKYVIMNCSEIDKDFIANPNEIEL